MTKKTDVILTDDVPDIHYTNSQRDRFEKNYELNNILKFLEKNNKSL